MSVNCIIHQPEHIPYCGFWCKLLLSDVWVVFDTAQYQKSHYHNRNKIAGQNGCWQWLTIPVNVATYKSPLNSVYISELFNHGKYLEKIRHSYSKAPAYEKVLPVIADAALRAEKHRSLISFNMELTESIARYIGIHRTTIKVSTLNLPKEQDKTMRLINICQAVSATTYIAGTGSAVYMDADMFEKYGIAVKQVSYSPYPYPQTKDFVSGMSILDLLMNVKEPKDILSYLRLSLTIKPLSNVRENYPHSL